MPPSSSTLYLPWQIGIAYVIGVPALMAAIAQTKNRRAAAVRRVLPVAVAMLVIGGVPFGLLLMEHSAAAKAIARTEYPGARPAERGGGIGMARAFGGVFDHFASAPAYAEVNGTNQSENAAGLPLGIGAVGLCLSSRETRARLRRREAWPLAAVLATCAVLTLWQVAPVPDLFGRPLLLFRIAPKRTSVPLAVGHVLAFVLAIEFAGGLPRGVRRRGAATGFVVLGAAQVAAGALYEVDGHRLPWPAVLAIPVVLAAVSAACFTERWRFGAGILCAFAIAQAAAIHPLQRGLDPLLRSPLRSVIEDVRRTAAPGAWVSFGGGPHVKATLAAAGVPNLSGISPYPDRAAWRVLDRTGGSERTWNRYAHLSFFVAPPGATARLVLEGEDSISVFVDPRGPELADLGVTVMVSLDAHLSGCGRILSEIPFGDGFVAFYEVDRGRH